MTFVEECIRDSIPLWMNCLKTEFLKAMAEGKLDTELLKGYIVEDSLYLREYARVFAWGMIRAKSMEEIRVLYSLLAFVNENEDAARLKYLKSFKLTDEQIQDFPLREENQRYIETMLETAKNGEGAAECLMAALPCMLSYAWIFRRMLQVNPDLKDTFCGPLIQEYASDDYERLCRKWTEFADELCGGISEERREKCRAVFRRCSEHEYQFWLMSGRNRTDL